MTDMQTEPTSPRATPATDGRPDVIVVGAGLAGLAAAIDVARAGHEVAVLDARDEIGGRARTADHEGFSFNEGAHALYRTGAAFAFLCREQLEPAGGEPTGDRAVGFSSVDGRMAPLPAGPGSLLRTPLLRGERLRFGRLFAGLGRLDAAALDSTSVRDGVARLVGARRGAQILHGLLRVATYGNDPEAMSAGAAIAQLRESITTPVRYVDGGWQTIVDALRTRLAKLGGTITTGTKVESVRAGADAVEVVAGGIVHRAAAVIVASGGPRQVEGLTGVDPAPFARPSTVSCLDVGLSRPWGDGPTFAVGLDQPLYLSVHAPTADLAPAGGALVSLLRYHPVGETPDADVDRAALEDLLDRVRPGWRRDRADVHFRARMVAVHDQPQAERGGLGGRADVDAVGHPRVSIAGDWVGGDGLLADAAFASARDAAARAVAQVAIR